MKSLVKFLLRKTTFVETAVQRKNIQRCSKLGKSSVYGSLRSLRLIHKSVIPPEQLQLPDSQLDDPLFAGRLVGGENHSMRRQSVIQTGQRHRLVLFQGLKKGFELGFVRVVA